MYNVHEHVVIVDLESGTEYPDIAYYTKAAPRFSSANPNPNLTLNLTLTLT